MKKVVRTVLIIVSSIIGIAGIGILAVNLYIQSKPTQQKIELKLSETLRVPLEIQRASLTPWGGLSILGITVPQANPDSGSNFLDAQECSIHFRFFPLFRRKLVIDQVLLDEPKVVWVQNANGRWVFPEAAPQPPSGTLPVPMESPSASPSPEIPQATPAPEKPAGSPPPATPEVQPRPGQVKPFEVVLSRLKIQKGAFDFSDAAGHRVALFSDVNVEVPSATPDLVEGNAWCEKISFRDRFFASGLKTRFSYSKERLALSGLNTVIAEGAVTGDLVIKTSQPRSPFTADVKLEKLDLNQLVSDAGGPRDHASGELSGFLDIYGQTADVNSIAGSGQLVLTHGQLNQYEVLQMLGKVLEIEELSQLVLQRASAAWRIENGVIQLDQLILQSANLRIIAHGEVKFDGRLDLDANLAINQKISRQLPEFVEANFKPIENTDLRGLDFQIFGTTSKPRTDLGVRVLGKEIEKRVEKKAVDLLQNIFGGKRKSKKNNPSTPAPATPTPSPAP